jgi:UDP-N-acetylmuramoylalanine--D-glutamate ligase
MEGLRSALVVGAARSGRAAARELAARGVRVRLHDARAEALAEAPPGVEPALGPADPGALLAGVDVLVKSPGVPAEAPVVAAARAAGLPVWSEVEVGYRLLPPGARLVGVTGTNGKTTTTELCAAMLGAPSAGNVGRALCDVAPGLAAGGVVVCELSSFQLEDVVTLRCDAAGLLNITPDHLDRHGSMEAYRDAKLRIFERQRPQDTAVLDVDDPAVAALGPLPGAGRRVEVRGADADAAGFAEGHLVGAHNRENVAVAAALARALGATDDAIRTAVRAFAPVPHRLEPVAEIDGVRFWNDSKATNVDATLKALTAFPDGRVHLILGGSDKGADFGPLVRALAGRVLAVYLTGPAGARMRPLFDRSATRAVWAGTVAEAARAAREAARPGDAVLLAPACASFDEFANYEARGEAFRELVLAFSRTP